MGGNNFESGFPKVLKETVNVYAHCTEGKKPETLQEHTNRCVKYYYRIMERNRLSDCFEKIFESCTGDSSKIVKRFLMYMIEEMVRFHDTGKINPAFQRVRMRHPYEGIADFSCLKGENHSLLSAYIYLDYCYNQIELCEQFDKKQKRTLRAIAMINAYVISKHHGDLDQMNHFCKQCAEGGDLDIIAEHFKVNSQPIYQGPFFFRERRTGIATRSWNNYKRGQNRKSHITLYFYTRLLYSLLVSCDYYATTEYMTGYEIQDFGENNQKEELIQMFEDSKLTQKIRKYESKRKKTECRVLQVPETEEHPKSLNDLRCELFLETERTWRQNKEKNLFFLEAPTGIGKSNTALNLSFQMLREGAERVYYIYPFNTLVEQNKISLEKIFGENKSIFSKMAVINSVTPIVNKDGKMNGDKDNEDSRYYYEKALLDRQFLNYPVVISTHVTWFQTLFSAKREALFGFSQMAHSVIVLDEIQSYRNEIWAEIIWFLQIFSELMDSRVVIMSATLPDLEYLTGQPEQAVHLLKNRDAYFCNPLFQNRVEISYELLNGEITKERLAQHIFSHTKSNQKVLVEFIKKDSAYAFYRFLCEHEALSMDVYLLTGDDNQADREKILMRIKEQEKKGIILISTQVIEAGVDIDMDVGYKDISKLDSEEQFMGRVNRSYKNPEVKGRVYFFNMDCAASIYKQDIRINREFTLENEDMREVLFNKSFSDYYEPVMQALKKQRNDQTTGEGLETFFDDWVAAGNFVAVEERMRLIDDSQWHMSVFLCRTIKLAGGKALDGETCWNEYKALLQNQTMNYAEKQVKLSEVRSNINYFIYQIKKNSNLAYNDCLGELLKIDNGEEFFENGKLNRKKLEESGGLFIDL